MSELVGDMLEHHWTFFVFVPMYLLIQSRCFMVFLVWIRACKSSVSLDLFRGLSVLSSVGISHLQKTQNRETLCDFQLFDSPVMSWRWTWLSCVQIGELCDVFVLVVESFCCFRILGILYRCKGARIQVWNTLSSKTLGYSWLFNIMLDMEYHSKVQSIHSPINIRNPPNCRPL